FCAVSATGYQNFYFGKGTSLTVIP
nr:T cell antigen receptor alpha chain CDR3 region=TCR V alpha 3.1 product [mice, C57BL/6, Peptide Partial, 24 aa] [Mus sp.]